MKRAALLVLMCLVLSTTMASLSASAGQGKLRIYEGTLSNGSPIGITLVLRQGKPPALGEFEFGAEMTCEDGTVQSWFVGFGWGGGPPKLPSHALDLDLNDTSSALHLHGKVQAIHGAGTMQFSIAAFTVDEEPQSCTTGELTWTVERTVPVVESPPPPEGIHTFRFVAANGAHVSMTRVR